MKTRKLNFDKAAMFLKDAQFLTFVKPLGSRLHRVFEVPDCYSDLKEQVEGELDRWCTRKRAGVWFFDLRGEREPYITEAFREIGAEPIHVTLDNVPDYSN